MLWHGDTGRSTEWEWEMHKLARTWSSPPEKSVERVHASGRCHRSRARTFSSTEQMVSPSHPIWAYMAQSNVSDCRRCDGAVVLSEVTCPAYQAPVNPSVFAHFPPFSPVFPCFPPFPSVSYPVWSVFIPSSAPHWFDLCCACRCMGMQVFFAEVRVPSISYVMGGTVNTNAHFNASCSVSQFHGAAFSTLLPDPSHCTTMGSSSSKASRRTANVDTLRSSMVSNICTSKGSFDSKASIVSYIRAKCSSSSKTKVSRSQSSSQEKPDYLRPANVQPKTIVAPARSARNQNDLALSPTTPSGPHLSVGFQLGPPQDREGLPPRPSAPRLPSNQDRERCIFLPLDAQIKPRPR